MKSIKTLIYSTLGAAAICSGFTACTDLEEHPYSVVIAEGHEFNESERASLFMPVYSSLRDFIWGWFGFTDIIIPS